jgi:hypothetical protein
LPFHNLVLLELVCDIL